MIGSLFAGTDESPGEIILFQGRSFKEYRGMGSLGAMRRGSRDRYFQDEFDLESADGTEKLVPEGHRRARRPQGQRGRDDPPARRRPPRRHGLLRLRARSRTLQRDAQLLRTTAAGVREGHVHDVIITKEAPNYRVE